MKKAILLLLILCNVLSACAKDYSAKIFRDCFNKEDASYEFNIRNPLFVEKFYVKDLKKLRNKIIKETYESYYVDAQGRKSYSDSYDRNVVYLYYFFDSEGRITDSYYVNENDKGRILYKQHESYKCLQDSYEILYKDFEDDTENTINGKIIKKNTGILLSFDKVYKNFDEIEFGKNAITGRRIFNENNIPINESLINDRHITKKYYSLKKGKEEKDFEDLFDKCCLIKRTDFMESGDELYEWTLDATGHGIHTYFKEGKTPEKVIRQEVYRRFNPIGFLEYEEEKPYNREIGIYSITEITVLSEKDDFFISHFN